MLTVLGGLAEFERDLIRARTGEGRERAKARGVKIPRTSNARQSGDATTASQHLEVATAEFTRLTPLGCG
jgi:DNA invertase Pin-like site-specific DNA recombinase